MYRIIFACLCILFTAPLMAQTAGRIQGTVRQAQTDEGLSDVNLILKNTVLGAVSGPDGRFVFPLVPPGTYTLTTSRLGFKTTDLSVTVTATETTRLDLHLETQPISLDAVNVEAQRPICHHIWRWVSLRQHPRWPLAQPQPDAPNPACQHRHCRKQPVPLGTGRTVAPPPISHAIWPARRLFCI